MMVAKFPENPFLKRGSTLFPETLYFIPFVKKDNFSLYYNNENLLSTEIIQLDKKTNFALSLDCGNETLESELEELINFKVLYYNKIKVNGSYPYTSPNPIDLNLSTYKDFYEKYNNSKYENKTKKLKTIENRNETIQGRYGDNIFQYFEISLAAKNEGNIDLIDKLLLKHDCKLEFHYSDISIDFNNYKNPIKYFINEVFLQLNPYFYLKMNTYFMNQYLLNDNDIFFPSKDDSIKASLFSRDEQYFLYKGRADEEKRLKDHEYYAKIYIRIDSKKTEIKRKYQTFFEYWADTFTFWETLFVIGKFFLNFYNRFYAFHSIQRKIFIFKGTDNPYFNYPKRNIEIKDLKNSSGNILTDEVRFIKINLNDPKTYIDAPKKEENKDNTEKKKSSTNIVFSFYYAEYLIIKFLEFFKCCKKYPQKMHKKKILFSKANDSMKRNLDIVLYIKNMLFLNIYRKIMNEDRKGIYNFLTAPIISPEESEAKDSQKNEKENNKKNYYHYCENDFDKFDYHYTELSNNPNQKEKDKKLIKLSQQHLNKLFEEKNY